MLLPATFAAEQVAGLAFKQPQTFAVETASAAGSRRSGIELRLSKLAQRHALAVCIVFEHQEILTFTFRAAGFAAAGFLPASCFLRSSICFCMASSCCAPLMRGFALKVTMRLPFSS
jgi:hypothetical protein